MSGFLVDTNVISELRKGDRADGGVRTWFANVDSDLLYLSVLVVGEIRRGIELIRRRDPESGQRLARISHEVSGFWVQSAKYFNRSFGKA